MPDGSPWPLISIVTPSFNQGRYLEENLRSVLEQHYPRVEQIVIDGGSTDETREVLARYRGSLAHVISEPDRGQGHAINKGMALASGTLLTWLNSDDRLAPRALFAMALAFHRTGADLVAGVCQLFEEGKETARHLAACR
ncbi:MAG: glycosyltransferase, partial [Magnetococcales bacterium]|nr:glycosyltransferase [Magnetococcales bacterium]